MVEPYLLTASWLLINDWLKSDTNPPKNRKFMKTKHCCDCAYWDGEPVGLWTALPNNMNWAANARFRCTHPKHFKQPKCNYRKACKYFEQKEVKAIIIRGEYTEDPP